MDSFFRQSYTDKRRRERPNCRDRLVALISAVHHDLFNHRVNSPTMRILPCSSSRSIIMPANINFGEFINYSDGLILFCQRQQGGSLIVFNPITQKSIRLPRPPLDDPNYTLNNGALVMGLACQVNNTNEEVLLVFNYRVVVVVPYKVMDKTLSIQTYSSKTRTWEKSTLIGTGKFSLSDYNNRPPVVLNGVFHWYAMTRHLAVYDSNINNNNHVQLIKLPWSVGELGTIVTRSSSDDVLWFVLNCPGVMKIWMLPKGRRSYRRSTTIPRKEWILMHAISHISLCNAAAPILISENEVINNNNNNNDLKMVLLYALIPWNPFVAVIKVAGANSVFLYNIETKSIELVKYDGSPITFDHSIIPYMESLSLSSYALN